MARSSLLGIDPAPTAAPGRDAASLGPGDSSDSGSDVAGREDDSDPGLPVDVALRDDRLPPLPLGESFAAVDGADIGVDRVFTPGDAELDDEAWRADVDLAGEADDEEEEEGEEDAEEDGAKPLRKGRRPAARPAPREAGDETDEGLPGETDPAERRPGRD